MVLLEQGLKAKGQNAKLAAVAAHEKAEKKAQETYDR